MLVCSVLLISMACTEQSSVDFETTIPKQRILVKDGWQNSHPMWRSDGLRVLYAARSVAKDSTLVREVDPTTNRIRTLFGIKGILTFPAYSADSTEFYCITNRLGDEDIWKYKPALAAWSRMSSEAGEESFVRLSQDGRYLAYISLSRLALLDMNTNRVTYLATPNQVVLSVSWDVGEKALLFSGIETFDELLYRFHLDSTLVEPVTASGMLGAWPVAAKCHSTAKLGNYIAFEESGGIDLYIPGEDRQTTLIAAGKMPTWSPDGTTLVYVHGDNLILEKIWVVIDE